MHTTDGLWICWERHDRNNNTLDMALCHAWLSNRLVGNNKDNCGYWSGRAAGWRAANEHYEKVRKLKSQSVFDYDKN